VDPKSPQTRDAPWPGRTKVGFGSRARHQRDVTCATRRTAGIAHHQHPQEIPCLHCERRSAATAAKVRIIWSHNRHHSHAFSCAQANCSPPPSFKSAGEANTLPALRHAPQSLNDGEPARKGEGEAVRRERQYRAFARQTLPNARQQPVRGVAMRFTWEALSHRRRSVQAACVQNIRGKL
jgi:hypothetical protein